MFRSRKKANDPDRWNNQRKRLNRTLWAVFIAVVGLHVVAGLIFGSVVIFRHLIKNEVLFEPASQVTRTLDPRKVTHEVSVQKRLNQSGRPPVMKRIQADRASDFALPEIELENPMLNAALQRKPIENFDLTGTGTGLGSGSGDGGGAGLGSEVTFFGVKSQAERIAIIVDASISMIEDERGGLRGYQAVKDELDIIFDSLSPGTYFTFILFAQNVVQLTGEPRLVDDTLLDNARELIKPVLTLEDPKDAKSLRKLAVRDQDHNYTPSEGLVPERNGPTRLDLAVLAALEQKPQIIFILSDGEPLVRKNLDEKEQEALDKRREEILKERERNPHYEKELARRREEFEKQKAREEELRERRGLPPKFQETGGGGPGGGLPVPPYMDTAVLLEELVDAAKQIYGEDELPRIYTVGYACSPVEERFLRDLSIAFRGRYRNLSRLVAPIRD